MTDVRTKLSLGTLRFRFDRCRVLVEKAKENGWDIRILEDVLAILQDDRP